MANLCFPQLATGALAQYPLRKTRVGRTVKNMLPDGTLIAYPDPGASRMIWQLEYSNLSSPDLAALTSHFNSCQGRLRAFTFIDPTDNMLVNSVNLSASEWVHSSLIQITPNNPDPNAGINAFSVKNASDASQDLNQTLAVPASYYYCFSTYILSTEPSTLQLVRQGTTNQQVDVVTVGPSWRRVTSSGRLTDPGGTFTVALRLTPGQQISVYGVQLEAQVAPSRYRPTLQQGGVYPIAHWGTDQLPVLADAPDSFSTVFSIEASI